MTTRLDLEVCLPEANWKSVLLALYERLSSINVHEARPDDYENGLRGLFGGGRLAERLPIGEL